MHIKINISPEEFERELEKANDRSEVEAYISDFFSKVAESSRSNFHRFTYDPDLLNWIVSEDVILIPSHKKHFTLLKQRKNTRDGTKNTPDSDNVFSPIDSFRYLEVVYGNENLTMGVKNWKIGHKLLDKNNILEQPILLVEGFDDCNFYDFLFAAEFERNGIGTPNFFAYPVGGSGDMKSGINRMSKKHGIIVSILDSDKFVPCSKKNDLHDSVKNVANDKMKKKNIFCFSVITPCHEAENFIPLHIIDMDANRRTRESTPLLESLIHVQGKVDKGKCLSLYYDYKNGFNKIKILENSNDSPNNEWEKNAYGDYWEFSTDNGDRKCDYLEFGFEIEFYLKRIKKSELPRYGDKIIKKFLGERGNDRKEEFKNYINGSGRTHWDLHFSYWFDKFLWCFIGGQATGIENA